MDIVETTALRFEDVAPHRERHYPFIIILKDGGQWKRRYPIAMCSGGRNNIPLPDEITKTCDIPNLVSYPAYK